MAALEFQERAATGEASGLLILHHGRGTDEFDLMPLADALDPGGRLHVVAPGGPLQMPGAPGRHWYTVHRVGYPEPVSFGAGYDALARFHDELWERTGIGPSRTVLGGFSQGGVMSYALGLGADRPGPAGILALSAFLPTVEGWEPHAADRLTTRVFIGHGRADPVISVELGRRARDALLAAGLEAEYVEAGGGHVIEYPVLRSAIAWLDEILALG